MGLSVDAGAAHFKSWIEDGYSDAEGPGLAPCGVLNEPANLLSVQVGVEDQAAITYKSIEM